MKAIDLVGQRFGKLVVQSKALSTSRSARWNCLCGCGTTTTVSGGNLRGGRTTSCGCERGSKIRAARTKHGMEGTPTLRTWRDMIRRCEDPRRRDFHHYGGRGIKVCERWHDFSAFVEDMGVWPAGMSLDRMDNDGDYAPENCRWATTVSQARNTRASRQISAFGRTQPLAAWASEVGIKAGTINKRLDMGWSVGDALSRPTAR